MACSIKVEHLLTKHINTLSFAHLKTCRMMKRSSLFRGCFFCIITAAFSVRVICRLIFGEISAVPQQTALLIGCTALLYLLLLAASSCISRDDMEQVRLLFRTN